MSSKLSGSVMWLPQGWDFKPSSKAAASAEDWGMILEMLLMMYQPKE